MDTFIICLLVATVVACLVDFGSANPELVYGEEDSPAESLVRNKRHILVSVCIIEGDYGCSRSAGFGARLEAIATEDAVTVTTRIQHFAETKPTNEPSDCLNAFLDFIDFSDIYT